jgi:hypothetical protein
MKHSTMKEWTLQTYVLSCQNFLSQSQRLGVILTATGTSLAQVMLWMKSVPIWTHELGSKLFSFEIILSAMLESNEDMMPGCKRKKRVRYKVW